MCFLGEDPPLEGEHESKVYSPGEAREDLWGYGVRRLRDAVVCGSFLRLRWDAVDL